MKYTALPGPTVCWVLRFGQPFTTITGARHGLRRPINIAPWLRTEHAHESLVDTQDSQKRRGSST